MKDLFKDVHNFEGSLQAIKKIDLFDLRITDFHSIFRQMRKFPPSEPYKIAYLGNFTLAPLDKYVEVFAARNGIQVTSHLGEYDQYYQEILDRNSDLISFDPQLLILALSLRNFAPDVVCGYYRLNTEDKKERIKSIADNIYSWTEHANNLTNANILVCNFPRPDYSQAGIADSKTNFSETEFYFLLNIELIRRFKDNQRVQILDLDRISARFGRQNMIDTKLYYLAKMEWSEYFLPSIADEIVRHLKASQNMTQKCLVLDLDNTLWGGVVGEDGPLGVKIGTNTDPISEAFYDFQQTILSIKNRGILLAICSKNNIADVKEVFEIRREMPLKFSDFSVKQINWDNKHENIVKIANSLNIGLESLVFIDDNPAECSLIEQMLPDVKTVCLPADPSQYPLILRRLNYFEKIAISKEDLDKSEQYRQKFQRQDHKAQFSDLSSYLASLKTEMTIRSPKYEDLNRIHQLFTKTNQFNVTTIRYNIGDIENFIGSDSYNLLIVEARDRFGDFGIIGLFLIEAINNDRFRIDSFILSCRAMGRGIESALMNHIKNASFNDKTKVTAIESIYIPTPKNIPVSNFFDEQGFTLVRSQTNGEKFYTLKKSESKNVDCSWINVMNEEEYNGRKS